MKILENRIKLPIDVKEQIKRFLQTNAVNIFILDDAEAMIEEFPIVLKEQIYFEQYDAIINISKFLQDIGDQECVWILVRHMKIINY